MSTTQNRAFSLVPENHRSPQNQREFAMLDKTLYDAENADYLTGYIGSGELLTTQDLARTPLLTDSDPTRNKYALSIGAVYVDPQTGIYSKGAFFDELVAQIGANGGITGDQNRLFETPYYAWQPPIDYDKHINFSRYFWTGVGSADVNGEYVTKEPAGSLIQVYVVASGQLVVQPVQIVASYPSSPTYGELVELSTDTNRLIYRWNGSAWYPLQLTISDTPASINLTDFAEGDYIYFCRTGPAFNRPLFWVYSAPAGRWIATPAVVSISSPDYPTKGMIWEDPTTIPYRVFRIYDGAQWLVLSYTTGLGPSGIPADQTHLYDTRNFSTISDPWANSNWWRHYEDLSAADRAVVGAGSNADQAVRPIVEFWGNLEGVSTTKAFRNQAPTYTVYGWSASTSDIEQVVGAHTTIFEYEPGSGPDDSVLGYPVALDSNGANLFLLTLQTDTQAVIGYRFFKDTSTGFVHSVWAKANTLLQQQIDSNGLYSVSDALIGNPNHQILTEASRGKLASHFGSVISSQVGFMGNEFGINSYRYSPHDPGVGATIIDPENSLLRLMTLLQDPTIYLPDVIRTMAREYNRVYGKFSNRMNQLWTSTTLTDATGTLKVTAQQAVDVILSGLFIGRNEQFPFYYSQMGTYTECRIDSTYTVTVTNSTPKPIFFPSSGARIGASPAYTPEAFIDPDGVTKLRGHDGIIVPSWGDARDILWLELQSRFFNAIPAYRRTETSSFSSRMGSAGFFLQDYYGNFTPITTLPNVNAIASTYTGVTPPSANYTVASHEEGVIALWDGTEWLLTKIQPTDVFLNTTNGVYYTYSVYDFYAIPTWNRAFAYDYTTTEYKQVILREYERWAAYRPALGANTAYDQSNRFTWNYSSAGVEGHYLGIYQRVYSTVRPHSHPWEIQGYSIEPTWWRTTYTPTSISIDGTPRYANTHAMWSALRTVNPQAPWSTLVGPTPVDGAGNLIDPIASGMITLGQLDLTTLGDAFTYGDGAPSEMAFYESPVYQFAVALAGLLMKPAIFTDTLWQDYTIDIGTTGGNPIWNAPHRVNVNTITRPGVGDLPVHLQVVGSSTTQNIGLNAWVSEVVSSTGGNVNTSFAALIDNTIPVLGWRAGGFVNPNRTVVETIGGIEIPFEDVHVLEHQAPVTTELFASGIAITREGSGFRVYGYDPYRPYFLSNLGVMPLNGGQVELRETFTPTKGQTNFTTTNFQIPQGTDLSRFSVLINGAKLASQYVSVTGKFTFSINPLTPVGVNDSITAVVLTTSSSGSTQLRSFTVQGRQFFYPAVPSGILTQIEYGHYFPDPNSVINFMIGYGRYLDSLGFEFQYIDPGTGEMTDWLNGAKRFAIWAIRTATLGNLTLAQTFYFSPFQFQMEYKTDFGMILNVEQIQNGSYGVIDNNALPIDGSNLSISRIDDTLTVTAFNNVQMFGIRLFITTIQHAIFFSQVTRFNDLIYDPIISLYHHTLRLDTYRSKDWNGRYEAAGFILAGNSVYPNFEKQAFDFTRFYDANNPPDDTTLRDQARNLIGYAPTGQTYLDQIGVDDRQKFKYFIGMLNGKGTTAPFTAYIRGTRLGTDNAIIIEDWAWQNTEFGDTRYDFCRFLVFKDDFQNDRQLIDFSDSPVAGNGIIYIPSLTRAPNENNPRWLVGPKATWSGPGNLTFPLNDSNLPDIANNKFFAEAFDDLGTSIAQCYYWDPTQKQNDPTAISLIDRIQWYDPAVYNTGVSAVSGAVSYWGADQVGMLWWDQSPLVYENYHAIEDDNQRAREWGRPLYFRATLAQTNQTVTVSVLDPLTKLPAAHNLATGALVDIVNADDPAYNIDQTPITVVDAETFAYVIQSNPLSPPSGDIQVIVGQVAVYEWVASPVSPDLYNAYVGQLTGVDQLGGTARPDGAGFSYGVEENTNQFGKVIFTYYFWVRNNTALNTTNGQITQLIEQRLRNPSDAGVPWFAPTGGSQMIIYLDGTRIQDNYSIAVSVDARVQESHVEWSLISEGDQNNNPPAEIMEKLIDSMAGIDKLGNVVPSPFLSDAEQIGNAFNPAQTVFSDIGTAISRFIDAFNLVFKYQEFTIDTLLDEVFPLSEELSSGNPNGFWQRTDFRQSAFIGVDLADTVTTTSERDLRLSQGLYGKGSLVEVANSGHNDLWTNSPVGATYEWDGTQWNQVGVNNWTVVLNQNVVNSPTVFRSVWAGLQGLLSAADQNILAFVVLREMLRQNETCSWFFKTSYLSVQIFDTIDTSPFIRPSESDAIIAMINDLKPFRSKVRTQTSIYQLPQPEDVATNIQEIPDMMITLVFDRLSSNTDDDLGFDNFRAFDEGRFDYPLWEYIALGTEDYAVIGTLVGNGSTTSITVTPRFQPSIYGHTFQIFQGSAPISASSIMMTVTVQTTSTQVIATTNYPLPAGFTLVVYQARGLVEGDALNPQLPADLQALYPDLSAYPSTYAHAAQRAEDANRPPYADMGQTAEQGEDPLGGSPPERVKNTISETVSITCTNSWSGAMAGFDSAGFDLYDFDEGPINKGDHSFYIMVGEEPELLPGLTVIELSETVTPVTGNYAYGTLTYGSVVQVYGQSISSGPYNLLTFGVDYTLLSGFPWIVVLNSTYLSVHLIYNNLRLGKTGTYEVISYDPSSSISWDAPDVVWDEIDVVWDSSDGIPYNTSSTFPFDIVDDVLTFASIPAFTSTILIDYYYQRRGVQAQQILAPPGMVVDNIWSYHGTYDGPNGFETDRPDGYLVLDQLDDHIWEWSSSSQSWTDTGAPSTIGFILVKATNQLYSWNGTSLSLTYTVGDTYSSLPLLTYPPFGEGVSYGTYAYGESPLAIADWPQAYEIMVGDSLRWDESGLHWDQSGVDWDA